MSDQPIERRTNRRNLLKLSGAGAIAGLAVGGLAPRRAMALDPESTITYASWIHGHSMQIEYPDRMQYAVRKGYAFQVAGNPGTENWFHFAIPTPVIIDDVRLRISSVMLRFVTGSVDAFLRDVHIYDGEVRIAVHNDVYLTEQNGFVRFEVPESPLLAWGVGISLGVGFGVEMMAHTMDFISAGADLVVIPQAEVTE